MNCEVEQYCLRWKYHHSNLQFMFAQLLENQSLCDVTLVCEGKTLRVHKIMLSACSAYFDRIFSRYDENDPIVLLEGVRFEDVNALVDFMYRGEITVDKSRLNDLIATAEELQVKGLAAVSWRSTDTGWKSVGGNVSGCVSGSASTGNISDDSESHHFSDVIKRKISDLSSNSEEKNLDYDATQIPQNSGENNVPDSLDSIDYHKPKKRKVYISAISEVTPSNMGLSNSLSENESDSEKEMGSRVTGDDSNVLIKEGGSNGERVQSPLDILGIQSVTTMKDYITQGGWRPSFWELESTKKVMEAIKNKKIEMKTGAELLGVNYGTLYGRYREVHGYLKQPQRDFWHDVRYSDIVNRLKKKEITWSTAADILGVNEAVLAYHIAMSERDGILCNINTECEQVSLNRPQEKQVLVKPLDKLKGSKTLKFIPILKVSNMNDIPPGVKFIKNTLSKEVKLAIDNFTGTSNQANSDIEADQSVDIKPAVEILSDKEECKNLEKSPQTAPTTEEVKLEIKEEYTDPGGEKCSNKKEEIISGKSNQGPPVDTCLVKKPGEDVKEAVDDLFAYDH